MKVYLVCTSNCEAWEDYSWNVDSAFASRDDAVEYITAGPDSGGMGMERVSYADPAKPFSRDRWHKVDKVYASREEYESEEEWREECFDENGEQVPVWVTEVDAWVTELELHPPSRGSEKADVNLERLDRDELSSLCRWLWGEWRRRGK